MMNITEVLFNPAILLANAVSEIILKGKKKQQQQKKKKKKKKKKKNTKNTKFVNSMFYYCIYSE